MNGERLKEVRKDHQDTQATLAKKLNVSTPTVSKWEQGATDPPLDCLIQICRMYEVSADYLLGLTENDPLLTKKRRETLSPDALRLLALFEKFLLDQEKSAQK